MRRPTPYPTPKAALLAALVLLAAIPLTTTAPAAQSVPPDPFTLAPVAVDLPTSTRAYPPGPGQAAMNANCLTCHSAGMVLNQPALTPAAWEAEVTKMRNIYKAPIPPDQLPPILTYLSTLKPAP